MLRILGFKAEMKGERRIDWVHVASRDAMKDTGEMQVTTWLRIDRIKPVPNMDDSEKRKLMEIRWSQIEPSYTAWLEGNAIPETGTPLGAWHGVDPEQAEALRGVGIATVEQLAAATENQLSRPPIPGMRALRDHAAQYLAGADAAAKDRQLAEMQAKLDAALEMLAEQAAAAEAKPRRGRPPKARDDAAEGEPEAEAA